MQRSHSWFFFICGAEGLIALIALLLIPSEGGSVSLARLALIGLLMLLSGAWVYLGFRPPYGLDKLARPGIIFLAALLSLTFSLTLFFLRYLNPERLLPIYERLSPLLWYLLIVMVQFVFLLLYIRYGLHTDVLQQNKQTYRFSLIAFGILFFAFLFIVITRLGITPDKAYWGEPGVAIQAWQFALVLLGGVFVLVLSNYWRSNTLDVLLPVSIYLIAVAIWLSVPLNVLANGFYVTIDPPTFQPFPYSDAGYYDRLAQSLLIGQSYFGEIPTRPLYVSFLFLLHKLFGENYPTLIMGQTFLLALIPVVFYFLGKKIHSRIAGVTVALFFIFRELTGLWITSNTRVTNSKSFLTDLPTLLLLLLSCYFTIRWLEIRDRKSALIAGGMFGLMLLLRTQSMLVFPFIVLAGLLVFGWRNRSLYPQFVFIALGIAAVLLPWLMHNYLRTGQVALDANFQYKLIASQYAYTGNLDISEVDLEGKSVGQVLIAFTLKDPGFVFGFMANHFLATEVDGMLALPLIKPYYGITAPVNLYWITWLENLEWYNVALLVFYLAVIALGFGASWKRWRWIGLVPLAYNLGYTLSNAVSRYSGWRYDFPADWVPYFYFGVGFAEIVILVGSLFGGKEELPSETGISRRAIPMPVYFAAFALIGAIPWMAEKASTPRYVDQSLISLSKQITALSNSPTELEIDNFTAQSNAFLKAGRVLYPRFFTRDKGLFSSNPWPAYEKREYPRMGFLLINQSVSQMVFPSREIPEPFPHAADAIVLGCVMGNHLEVRMIAFPDQNVIFMSAPLSEPCSP
ncbi:MAG: glycosyltransferase family 39 protein [Anaerolineales bacterium]